MRLSSFLLVVALPLSSTLSKPTRVIAAKGLLVAVVKNTKKCALVPGKIIDKSCFLEKPQNAEKLVQFFWGDEIYWFNDDTAISATVVRALFTGGGSKWHARVSTEHLYQKMVILKPGYTPVGESFLQWAIPPKEIKQLYLDRTNAMLGLAAEQIMLSRKQRALIIDALKKNIDIYPFAFKRQQLLADLYAQTGQLDHQSQLLKQMKINKQRYENLLQLSTKQLQSRIITLFNAHAKFANELNMKLAKQGCEKSCVEQVMAKDKQLLLEILHLRFHKKFSSARDGVKVDRKKISETTLKSTMLLVRMLFWYIMFLKIRKLS